MAKHGASTRRGRDLQISNFLGRPTRIVVVIILLAVVLFPLYWLVSNSFKQDQEIILTQHRYSEVSCFVQLTPRLTPRDYVVGLF